MKITIYTIPDCTFCTQEKEYLTSKGLQFEEKNVQANKDVLAEMLNLSDKFAGVPFTVIIDDSGKEHKLKGFTKAEFDAALGGDTEKAGDSGAPAASVALGASGDSTTSGAPGSPGFSGAPAASALGGSKGSDASASAGLSGNTSAGDSKPADTTKNTDTTNMTPGAQGKPGDSKPMGSAATSPSGMSGAPSVPTQGSAATPPQGLGVPKAPSAPAGMNPGVGSGMGSGMGAPLSASASGSAPMSGAGPKPAVPAAPALSLGNDQQKSTDSAKNDDPGDPQKELSGLLKDLQGSGGAGTNPASGSGSSAAPAGGSPSGAAGSTPPSQGVSGSAPKPQAPAGQGDGSSSAPAGQDNQKPPATPDIPDLDLPKSTS